MVADPLWKRSRERGDGLKIGPHDNNIIYYSYSQAGWVRGRVLADITVSILEPDIGRHFQGALACAATQG